MQKRRLARLVLVVALAAGSVGACGGGSKAGDGQTSPPSTSPK